MSEFYACTSADQAFPATGKSTGGRKISRSVDIHCHMGVPEAAALMKPHFKPELDPGSGFNSPESVAVNHAMAASIAASLTTVEGKLADMDRLGIEIQVLSPAPPQYFYWADAELGLQSSRLINERIAATVASHPDRFAGLATLPMQEPSLAVAELRRCMKDLGMKGVEISTNVSGVELSDPRFRPFFAAAEELGALIFLHPMGFTHGQRMSTHYLNNLIGNPLESTLAVSHLIFGGVLDDHPGLRICVAHGGGYLASYTGRMDHAHRTRLDCQCCKRLPSTYLKNMYFDTVVFDRQQLRHMVDVYGADRILMGSDHPFDMGDPDPIGSIRALELPEDQFEKIVGGNARALLGLDT